MHSTRQDAAAKAMGLARYTDDFAMPGMLHAVYVRAPLAHGLVKAVHTGEALAVAGVVAVFTAGDVPEWSFATAGHPWALDSGHRDVADCRLLTDHVRYDGDEVAVVVAEDELTARRAAALVQVEYEELEVLTAPERALERDAPLLHKGHDGGNLLAEGWLRKGDAEDALKKAAVLVEGEYNTPMVQHCHMENQTAYAYMDDNKRVTIVSSTQIPHLCRTITAQALGWDESRIQVIKPYVGGGFGNKQDVILEPMVAFLSIKLGGRAVKITMNREECLLNTRVRHPFDIKVTLGADAYGNLTALGVDVVSHTGAYASHGHGIAMAAGGKSALMYSSLPYFFHARTVYGNLPVGGAMRGYGSPQVCFAVECAVEDMARKLGEDSVEFRVRNSGKAGDRAPDGHVLLSHGLVECLKQGARQFDWQTKKAQAKREGGLRSGVGVASFSYGTGTWPANMEAAGARLTLAPDGVFLLGCGATEIGQGADAVLGGMAARVLGVAAHGVRVVSTQDTDVTPFDSGAYASRQTYIAGHAVKRCAEEMLVKVLARAAIMSGVRQEELLLCNGEIEHKGSGKKLLSLRDIAMDSVWNKERGGGLFAESALTVQNNPASFGCTFARVEVDMDLCRLKVTELLNVHDSGKIMNYQTAMGQVQGGMAMGLGWALFEEMLWNTAGRVYNNNLLDYKIPTAVDLSDLHGTFVENWEPESPFGNKSLGEPPLVSVAPAVRNALFDATGLALNTIPFTPGRLYAAFRQAGLTR